MRAHWSLDDIPWHAFDASKVRPELVSIAKAACMVEHNGQDYARYLCEVFSDDPAFQQVARDWGQEEIQHGQALRKWAELADPGFDFDKSFAIFTAGYQLPSDVHGSVRGSRCGELVARCVVETGTSSYYTAIREYTEEPVLKALCAKIAADELRHYKLFYSYLGTYLRKEKIGTLQRLRVAFGRIAESDDDELSYAFFAAHCTGRDYGLGPYDRKRYNNTYLACMSGVYRKPHIDQMAAMVFKAVGLKPHTALNRATGWLAWKLMQLRTYRLRNYRIAAPVAA